MLIVGSPTINGDKANRYYHEIIRFIDENNLKDKVTLLSHTDDIQLFYNAVDIFALATDGETYGMVTIEAMLSGVPVLATNTGGTLEILDYGKLGYLYTPHNVNEFCTKLTEMVSDSGKLEALSRAAQASAIARFPHVYECEQIELLLG
jgi:glycosyltransferase involved in cell wall biosynthesis